MASDDAHAALVNAWLERAGKERPPEELVELCSDGLAALWRRAHQTLGDVTLTAIVDRVLFTATEQFPFLSSLTLEEGGMRCDALREHARDVDREQLLDGIRFILVELLTLLGTLTGEILSAPLHAELWMVRADETDPDDQTAEEGPSKSRSKAGEGTKP
jgi:hypothetical protein